MCVPLFSRVWSWGGHQEQLRAERDAEFSRQIRANSTFDINAGNLDGNIMANSSRVRKPFQEFNTLEQALESLNLTLFLFFQSGIPPGPYIPGSVDEDELYPVDFLEGKMDLRVVLPSMSVVRMQVERR